VHKDHPGITAPGSVERLACALGDDLHVDLEGLKTTGRFQQLLNEIEG
jgi:hypothetical protein